LKKGDLILVRWNDASEFRASLNQHVQQPSVHVKDWGVFLGVTGKKRRHIVIGKDVVELFNEWSAARIPLELVNNIVLVMKGRELSKVLTEIQLLTRRVRLRRLRFDRYARIQMA